VTVTAGPKGKRDMTPLPWKSRATGGDHFRLFCKRYLKVPRGKGAKQAFNVRPWQQGLVAELLDPAGTFLNVWVLPRGNGKSGLAASIALHHVFTSGIEGARVVIVAQDDRRATAMLKTAARMVSFTPELDSRSQIYADRIVIPGTDSSIVALPGEAHRVEGEDATLVIVDEIGFVPKETWEAAIFSAGKRDGSRVLGIGTPSPVKWRERSPLHNLVLSGRAGTNDSLTVHEFGAPVDDDITDPATWAKANPAYGDWLDDKAIRGSLPPASRESEFRRARLGQWVEHDDASFVTEKQWKNLARPGVKIPPGTRVVLAFDGSQRGDSTALLVLSVSSKPHVQVGAMWEPSEEGQADEVVVTEVEDKIRELASKYRVVELVGDPWGYKRTLQILADEGLNVTEFSQNSNRLTPATSDLHAAIVAGSITHDGDPRLTRHILNATVSENERGIRLDKTVKALKIDGASALVMGYSRASWLTTKKGGRRGRVRSFKS